MAKKRKKNKIKLMNKKAPGKKSLSPWFILFFGTLFIGLPFVYYRQGLDPAIHPRLLFVDSVLIISLLVFLFTKSKIDYSAVRNPGFIFIAAYFIITAVSLIFAINPLEGNYDLIKTFSFLVLTVFMTLLLVNKAGWQKVLPFFFIVPAVFLFARGAGEYYDYVLFAKTDRSALDLPWIYNVRGNMAHKNQYSIALMMMLPFLGFGIYRAKGLWRAGFILVVCLLLLMILLVQTRAVWVGLFVGVNMVAVFLVFLGARFGIPLFLRRIAGFTMLAGIIGYIGVVAFAETDDQDSVLYKVKNITNPDDENNVPRVKTWNLSIDLISDHFFIGVGAGNWKINSRYYFENSGFNKNQLNWLRPHNDYLWVISEKGIFGFMAFLGIFVWGIIMCFKIMKHSNEKDDIYFAIFMFFGLVAYMMAAFFTFPLERMNHQVYLALILAAIVATYHRTKPKKMLKINPVVPVIVSIGILGYGFIYAYSVIQMETKVNVARNYHKTQQWDKLLEVSNTIPTTLKSLDAEAMPIAWYRGLANSKLGNLKAANEDYKRAFAAHPTHVQVLNNLGRTYFQLGEYEKARDAFLAALEILPEYYQALVNVTSTYMEMNDWEKADFYYQKIKRKRKNKELKKMGNTIGRKLSMQKKASG